METTFMIPLETERLLLRKHTLEDAPFILQLFNSPGWLKYIGDRNVHTVEEAATYLKEKHFVSYETNGFGSYLVVLKETGAKIGSCGIYKRDNLDHPDIGFAFLPDYLGKGYGYESAKAVMNRASSWFKDGKILGFTVPNNTASIKLLEKLGLHQEGTYTFDNTSEDELLLFTT